MSVLDTMISRLPSNYNTKTDSNINKLFCIVATEIDELNTAIQDVQKNRDVDNSNDNSLDRIGRNVLEVRGSKTDEEFRAFIKTKIRANLSGGEADVISEMLDLFLEDDFVNVKELYNDPNFLEPAAFLVEIKKTDKFIPFEIIKRITAAGVRVEWSSIDPPNIHQELKVFSHKELKDYNHAFIRSFLVIL